MKYTIIMSYNKSYIRSRSSESEFDFGSGVGVPQKQGLHIPAFCEIDRFVINSTYRN